MVKKKAGAISDATSEVFPAIRTASNRYQAQMFPMHIWSVSSRIYRLKGRSRPNHDTESQIMGPRAAVSELEAPGQCVERSTGLTLCYVGGKDKTQWIGDTKWIDRLASRPENKSRRD